MLQETSSSLGVVFSVFCCQQYTVHVSEMSISLEVVHTSSLVLSAESCIAQEPVFLPGQRGRSGSHNGRQNTV